MNKDDTVKLLERVNEGIKMGVSCIDDVMGHVGSEKLTEMLKDYRKTHGELGNRTHEILNKLGETDKEPPAMAKMMSSMKTNMKLTAENTDAQVAEIVSDGCHTGTKALSKYLNEYSAADMRVRDIARELIDLETSMMQQLRAYL